MAVLSALVSFLSRKIGTLVRALFGWSVLALFGRLTRPKQLWMTVALVLAILWPLVVVGAIFPAAGGWLIAFLPLEEWIAPDVLRLLWIALAVFLPIAVGVIVRGVASEAQKGGKLRSLLGGYPLTLGFGISFLITLITVPVLKLIAAKRRWKDEHVFMQPQEGKYHVVLGQIAQVCADSGVPIRIQPMPASMALSTRVIKGFARGALDPIVADDPRMLRGDGLALYLYPADLLLRGEPRLATRVRAALLQRMPLDSVRLVQDGDAQRLEDDLRRLWQVVARHRPSELGAAAQSRVRALAAELESADVPYEDWILLYTYLHRLERLVCGGPTLVDPPAVSTATATVAKPAREPSTMQLVKAAIEDARTLLALETALARDEVRADIKAAKGSLIGWALAAAAVVIGVALLLVAVVAAITSNPWAVLALGALLVAAGGAAAFYAYRALPKKPLQRTRERLELDVKTLKERAV